MPRWVTTAEDMELLARHRGVASVEVTPQHLPSGRPLRFATTR